MHTDEAQHSDDAEDYRSHGRFDALDAHRMLPELEREGIRFRVHGSSGLVYGRWSTQLRRFDEVEIAIHHEDEAKARKILSGDNNV